MNTLVKTTMFSAALLLATSTFSGAFAADSMDSSTGVSSESSVNTPAPTEVKKHKAVKSSHKKVAKKHKTKKAAEKTETTEGK